MPTPPATAKRGARKAAPSRSRSAAPHSEAETLKFYWENSDYTLADIARLTGLTQTHIRREAKRLTFAPRTYNSLSKARRRKACEGAICPGLAACPKRNHLAGRLLHVVEREIFRLNGPPGADAVDVKALSALSTVLGRLFLLDREIIAAPAEEPVHGQDPYAPPVARRIRDAVAEALGRLAEGSEGSGEDDGLFGA